MRADRSGASLALLAIVFVFSRFLIDNRSMKAIRRKTKANAPFRHRTGRISFRVISRIISSREQKTENDGTTDYNPKQNVQRYKFCILVLYSLKRHKNVEGSAVYVESSQKPIGIVYIASPFHPN